MRCHGYHQSCIEHGDKLHWAECYSAALGVDGLQVMHVWYKLCTRRRIWNFETHSDNTDDVTCPQSLTG